MARISIPIAALVLALAWPRAEAAESGKGSETACEDQTQVCSEIPREGWPGTNFRIGTIALLAGAAKPFRPWGGESYPVLSADIPLGVELSFGGTFWRYGIILAPVGFHLQSDGTATTRGWLGLPIGHNVIGSLQIGWLDLDLGLPDYDWNTALPVFRRFRWSQTSFGASVVMMRFPGWDRLVLFPEWRQSRR